MALPLSPTAPMNIDAVGPPGFRKAPTGDLAGTDASAAFPTPSSIPRRGCDQADPSSYPGMVVAVAECSPSPPAEASGEGTGSDVPVSPSMSHDLEVFPFDSDDNDAIDVDSSDSGGFTSQQHSHLVSANQTEPASFSANILIRRPYRARYHSPSLAPPSLTLEPPVMDDRSISPEPSPSSKRSFDTVSPPSPPYAPREVHARTHSFESQRAVASARFLERNGLTAEGLRRRVGSSRERERRERSTSSAFPVDLETERQQERERSKRRREESTTAPQARLAPVFPLDPVLSGPWDAAEAARSSQELACQTRQGQTDATTTGQSLPSLSHRDGTALSPSGGANTFPSATSTAFRLAPAVSVGQPTITSLGFCSRASRAISGDRSTLDSLARPPFSISEPPTGVLAFPNLRHRHVRDRARNDPEADRVLGDARARLERADRSLRPFGSTTTEATTIPSHSRSSSQSPPSGNTLRGFNFMAAIRARRSRQREDWDETTEAGEAERLSRTIEAARAARAEEALWGEFGTDTGSGSTANTTQPPLGFGEARPRVLRGPTQSANERWRLGASSERRTSSTDLGLALHPESQREESAVRHRRRDPWADWYARPDLDDDAQVRIDRLRAARDELSIRQRAAPTRPRVSAATSSLSATATFSARSETAIAAAPSALALLPEDRTRLRITPRPARVSSNPAVSRASLLLGDRDDDESTSQDPNTSNRVAGHHIFMLPSGSDGHRLVFPHPADARGESVLGVAGGLSDDFELPEPRETLRSFNGSGFDFARSPRPALRQLPSEAMQSASSSLDSARSDTVRRRASLAEALARLGAPTDDISISSASPPAPMRRWHVNISQSRPSTLFGDSSTSDSRIQRLARLRQERAAMESLLSGSRTALASPEPETLDADQTRNPLSSPPLVPRSPGSSRGRVFRDFLRSVGGSGSRFGALFDDDFNFFWGRDSAALDPRNYLDDDQFDDSYEALLRLSERLGDVKPKGVSADKMAKLQRFAYRDWPLPARRDCGPRVGEPSTSAATMGEDAPTLARKGFEKEERCAVCLMDYEDDDECMLGHCGHGFHSDCLTAWLKGHAHCPLCRQNYQE